MKKKRLIVVCDQTTKEYGDYLMALISKDESEKDAADRIIGEDVEVFLWDVKQYKKGMYTLNHDNYILFLGDFDEARIQAKCIDWEHDKYRMRYGWLGKRAVLYVDGKGLYEEEYKDFVDYANANQDCIKFEKIDLQRELFDSFSMIDMLVDFRILSRAPYSSYSVMNQQYRFLVTMFYLNGLKKYLG